MENKKETYWAQGLAGQKLYKEEKRDKKNIQKIYRYIEKRGRRKTKGDFIESRKGLKKFLKRKRKEKHEEEEAELRNIKKDSEI